MPKSQQMPPALAEAVPLPPHGADNVDYLVNLKTMVTELDSKLSDIMMFANAKAVTTEKTNYDEEKTNNKGYDELNELRNIVVHKKSKLDLITTAIDIIMEEQKKDMKRGMVIMGANKQETIGSKRLKAACEYDDCQHAVDGNEFLAKDWEKFLRLNDALWSELDRCPDDPDVQLDDYIPPKGFTVETKQNRKVFILTSKGRETRLPSRRLPGLIEDYNTAVNVVETHATRLVKVSALWRGVTYYRDFLPLLNLS